MTENSAMVFLVLILMIIAFAGSLYVRALLTRRAIFKVIDIFYQHQALGTKAAKSRREIGLERPDFLQRMTKPRDYKQYALQILIKREIVIEDEQGRLCLVEDRLDQNMKNRRKNYGVSRLVIY